MTPEEVRAKIGDVPWMSVWQARLAASLITVFRLRNVLELGTYHGVSAAHFAAMVEPLNGHVLTVDVASTPNPTPEEVLAKVGQTQRVSLVRDSRGAEWVLLGLIERQEQFDLVYIDANHTWRGAGFQWLLMDKVVRPGGWVIFDDLNYSVTEASAVVVLDENRKRWMASMTAEERDMRQVRKVWDLLVKPHPGFTNFQEHGNWGLCQRRAA